MNEDDVRRVFCECIAVLANMAKAEGYTPAEIQQDFGITPTRYDTTLRRIRRRLNEYDQERTEQ